MFSLSSMMPIKGKKKPYQTPEQEKEKEIMH